MRLKYLISLNVKSYTTLSKVWYERDKKIYLTPSPMLSTWRPCKLLKLCVIYNIQKRWFKSNKYVRYFTWRTPRSCGTLHEIRSKRCIILLGKIHNADYFFLGNSNHRGTILFGTGITLGDAIYVYFFSQLYVKLD